MHRNIKVQKTYIEHVERKNATGDTSCDMCRLIVEKPVVLEDSSFAFDTVCLIENEFPYENNDGRRVEKHHMIVPREHSSKLGELPEATRKELHDTIDALLDTGVYHSAYLRSSYNPAVSVPLHLHAHLFKFGPKVIKQVYDPANDLNEIEFEA